MSAPDPDTLGDTLKQAADAATPRPIDVDAVLRASRARRRSRRTAIAGGVGAGAAVLLIGGGIMTGLQGLQGLGGPDSAQAPVTLESAESGEVAPDADDGAADDATGQRLVAPEQVNRCGAPVAAPTDTATSPLAVAVEPATAPVPPGTTSLAQVTITNAGTDVVEGTIDAVVPLTVAADGITVWHSGRREDLAPRPISLAPGESTALEGTFETRSCDEADEIGRSLPPDLPALAPGGYGVGAVVSFTAPDGVIAYLVSPLAPVDVG